MPKLTVPDGDPLVEVNHCHGPGKGHPCAPGEGKTASLKQQAASRARRTRAQIKSIVNREGEKPVAEMSDDELKAERLRLQDQNSSLLMKDRTVKNRADWKEAWHHTRARGDEVATEARRRRNLARS